MGPLPALVERPRQGNSGCLICSPPAASCHLHLLTMPCVSLPPLPQWMGSAARKWSSAVPRTVSVTARAARHMGLWPGMQYPSALVSHCVTLAVGLGLLRTLTCALRDPLRLRSSMTGRRSRRGSALATRPMVSAAPQGRGWVGRGASLLTSLPVPSVPWAPPHLPCRVPPRLVMTRPAIAAPTPQASPIWSTTGALVPP